MLGNQQRGPAFTSNTFKTGTFLSTGGKDPPEFPPFKVVKIGGIKTRNGRKLRFLGA